MPSFARRWLFAVMSLWPPLLGAGIRVRRIPGPPLSFETRMKLCWWNRNYVGTHFGGSLYAMCDPFYMLILLHELGPGYVVWDKAATVRFLRPGRGEMRASFVIPRQRIEEIRQEADGATKTEPRFLAEVRDGAGELVAEVDKLLYVRRRERMPS